MPQSVPNEGRPGGARDREPGSGDLLTSGLGREVAVAAVGQPRGQRRGAPVVLQEPAQVRAQQTAKPPLSQCRLAGN